MYSTDTESLTKGTKTFSKRFLMDFERLKLNAKRAKKNIVNSGMVTIPIRSFKFNHHFI